MAIKEGRYIVLQKDRVEKRGGESWLEILKRWLVQCPQCTEVWLVVGARENDPYICKDCGHSFTIKFLITASDISQAQVATARERN
jgi:transposase-like protein